MLFRSRHQLLAGEMHVVGQRIAKPLILLLVFAPSPLLTLLGKRRAWQRNGSFSGLEQLFGDLFLALI